VAKLVCGSTETKKQRVRKGLTLARMPRSDLLNNVVFWKLRHWKLFESAIRLLAEADENCKLKIRSIVY